MNANMDQDKIISQFHKYFITIECAKSTYIPKESCGRQNKVRTKLKVLVQQMFARGNFLSSALHHVVWLKWIRRCQRYANGCVQKT